jgi:hypothetical protein
VDGLNGKDWQGDKQHDASSHDATLNA